MSDKVTNIESPVSGTFYRRASPEENPYVEVGDEIKRGDVVCMVESMKMFIEVRTRQGGTIQKILLQDEAPVIIGQPLFELEVT